MSTNTFRGIGHNKNRYRFLTANPGRQQKSVTDYSRYSNRPDWYSNGDWSEQDDALILTSEMSVTDLAKKLGRTKQSIYSRRHKLRKVNS